MQHLQSFLGNLNQMMPLKKAEREYYTKFSTFLDKYEQTKLKNKIGALAHVQLISGEGNNHLKNKLESIGTTF